MYLNQVGLGSPVPVFSGYCVCAITRTLVPSLVRHYIQV